MTPKATFLDRNKKKSALAALLLFLRQRKALLILLLLVVLATMTFVAPSASVLARFPRMAAGIAWITQKMGMGGPTAHSYNDLVASFRAAKAEGKTPGWSAMFAGGGAASGSSLDFVKGRRADLNSGVVDLPQNGSVKGILTPDDAKADPNGNAVAVDSNAGGEREGFVKNAFAGGFMKGLFGDGSLSGTYAGKGFFNGGPSAATGPGELARNGLEGLPKPVVPQSKIKGGFNGKLSAMASAGVNARAMTGQSRASSLGGNRAFVQLAQGRGRAALATSPNCGSDCPGEFAATNTGAIYDGNPITGSNTNLLSAPQVDSIGTPNVPNSGLADGYEQQADQMDADAKKCQAADAEYGPEETALDQQMQSISNQFKSMDCGSGGCSKSKAEACQALGNQLHSTCSQYMAVRCANTRACPLTANQNCTNECSDTGNPTQKNVEVVAPDTSGNTDGSGSKSGDD